MPAKRGFRYEGAAENAPSPRLPLAAYRKKHANGQSPEKRRGDFIGPETISRAELVIDEPAHVLWKEKRPLVRKLKLSEEEWLLLAVNPWQPEDVTSKLNVRCGVQKVELPLVGRQTGIFAVQDSDLRAIP